VRLVRASGKLGAVWGGRLGRAFGRRVGAQATSYREEEEEEEERGARLAQGGRLSGARLAATGGEQTKPGAPVGQGLGLGL